MSDPIETEADPREETDSLEPQDSHETDVEKEASDPDETLQEEQERTDEVLTMADQAQTDALEALEREGLSRQQAELYLAEEREEFASLEVELKNIGQGADIEGAIDDENGQLEQMAQTIQREVTQYTQRQENNSGPNAGFDGIVSLANMNMGMVPLGLEKASLVVAYTRIKYPELALPEQVEYAKGLVGQLNKLGQRSGSSAEQPSDTESPVESEANTQEEIDPLLLSILGKQPEQPEQTEQSDQPVKEEAVEKD